MKRPPSVLLPLLRVAADLRACGNSWEKVAARVDRSARTCRGWPLVYPEVWQQLYAQAERRFFAEAAVEAGVVLRQQLRSDEQKISHDAARQLLQVRAKLGTEEKRRPRKQGKGRSAVAQYLKGLNDAQLQALIDRLARSSAAPSQTAAES